MLRTALLCAAMVCGAYAGAARLTHGFQAWTAEDARRLEVAQSPVPAPAVAVQGPGVAAPDLRALVASGRGVTIAEFFYTRCETVCQAGGAVFQQMQQALQQAPAGGAPVRLLSISFDPARDGPGELADYARRMRADPHRWTFVRVPLAADNQRLLDAFRVTVVPSGHGDFEHNAALLVLDRDGRLVRIFDLAQHQMVLDYALQLAQDGAS